MIDTLQVTGDFASLTSKSLWGSLRGLETFSQLIYENDEGTVSLNNNKFKLSSQNFY
jgi:hypothetical protein